MSLVYLALGAGICSHLLYFMHGEHHIQAPILIRVYFVLLTAFVLGDLKTMAATGITTGQSFTVLLHVYFSSVLASTFVYRTFFHPLKNFPGPFGAKVSKFWNVLKAYDSSNFRLMDSLYHEYGDFVRTGPNEIAVFRPEVIRVLDGPGTKCSKAPWYDILQPRVSLATTRDKILHDQRRKTWEQALAVYSFQDYEQRLLRFTEGLHAHIASRVMEGVDVSKMFYYYSFDVMSDLAFGESLHMLVEDKNHFALRYLQEGMELLGPLSPVPWLVRFGMRTPGVAGNFKRLIKWSGQKLNERMQKEAKQADIVASLIQTSRQRNTLEQDLNWLAGDTFAIVIAGSDTVASTLVSIFWHLIDDAQQLAKLRRELDECPDLASPTALQSLQHLNAIINEALRLHPALPSGGLRQTPHEGIHIAGQFIPGDVTIVAPRYTIGRLESCYTHAEKFIPERWYSKPDLIKDRSAFAPFSIGRYNCIGKRIALLQVRSVVARLIMHFDVAFAPDEDGIAVWRDLKDQFNSHPGQLKLVFTARK